MRGDDNDRVGGRKCGASATCSAIARRCWEKLKLAEGVTVTFSSDGAKRLVLRATPNDLGDFAVGFNYTKGNGVMVAPSVASHKPAVKSRRRGSLVLGCLMAAVAAGVYVGWQHFAHNPGAAISEAPPPVPVIATTVQKQNFPIVLTGIGNVAALNSATVRSMVTEPIISIGFEDGEYVKKGQLLAQLDPSTYQAELDQAEANIWPATKPISKTGGSISADMFHWRKKGLHPSSYPPRRKRRSLRKRPLSKLIRRRSHMPRPSSAIRNWWRRSTGSPEFVYWMSAILFTRARHGALQPNRMHWS
jgi:Biotin-lipoyl like